MKKIYLILLAILLCGCKNGKQSNTDLEASQTNDHKIEQMLDDYCRKENYQIIASTKGNQDNLPIQMVALATNNDTIYTTLIVIADDNIQKVTFEHDQINNYITEDGLKIDDDNICFSLSNNEGVYDYEINFSLDDQGVHWTSNQTKR